MKVDSKLDKSRNSSETVAKEHPSHLKGKYPSKRKEYEKMMRHDAHRRVCGSVRQTRWSDRG